MEDSQYSSFSEILSTEEDDLEVFGRRRGRERTRSERSAFLREVNSGYCGRLLSFRPRVGVRHESPTASLSWTWSEVVHLLNVAVAHCG